MPLKVQSLVQSLVPNPTWPTGHNSASGPCSHMASYLHDIALVDLSNDSGFWKYSWAHLVMSMTKSCRWVMQCCLRPRRPLASNKGLRPCPLRTEISPVSLNILMVLCTVDEEICKAFAIWHWGLPIFPSERLCLSVTDLMSINVISC